MTNNWTRSQQVFQILHELGGSGTRVGVTRIMQDRFQGSIDPYETAEVGLTSRPGWHHRMDATNRILFKDRLVRCVLPRGFGQLSVQGWLSGGARRRG